MRRSVSLERAISKVVKNGNCCGCGACALISGDIHMALSREGFMRPSMSRRLPADSSAVEEEEARTFKRVCPGLMVEAPAPPLNARTHPVFGAYISAWSGWATDPDIRFRGSSGGILSALSIWLLETGRASSIVASTEGPPFSTRTVPVRITTREDAVRASGSRYAPVASLTEYEPHADGSVLIGKPCEVAAAARLHSALDLDPDAGPVLLSFFCAGTPSQRATTALISSLGVHPSEAVAIRYRGNGWPGDFTVSDTHAQTVRASYDESWGQHLGRDLQWRCRICVDGTAGHADIAVGDYWMTDAEGRPTFVDAEGVSAVIARTARGLAIIQQAARDGVLSLDPLVVDDLTNLQPLQRDRKYTLAGRLLGRLLTLKRIPHYRGYGLIRLSMQAKRKTLRSLLGTVKRSVGW